MLGRINAAAIIMAFFLTVPAMAQGASQIDAQILEEGMERSQIMQTLHMLTDRYGPRLTGSPNADAAGEWAMAQLEEWGAKNAYKEAWDWGHPGWLNRRFSAHIVSPVTDPLVGEVLGWTPSTQGTVTAEVFHILPPERPSQQELDTYLAEIGPQVSGKIVLVGDMTLPPNTFTPPPLRRDDDQVRETYDPSNTAGLFRRNRRGGNEGEGLSRREVGRQIDAFLLDSGAAVRVDPARMEDGLIRAFANRSYDPARALPTMILRNEDYGRIARLIQDGETVTLEVYIENEVYPDGETAYNYFAEIPGTENPEEVVMIGGHLDSWHAATGATDNAAGVAIMMEAIRILTALGVQPRRTIRIAMWTGEEQGLLGSQAYVAEHFGTFEDQKPEYAGFNGYINVDSGTGRLRGATVFGPTEAAAVLEDILVPFDSLGMAGARPTFSRSLGGSDHTAFNQAGLPGISMGQDPIRYFSHTWHTNLDTYERILKEDVQQAAVIVAATAYHLAMRDEMLPRFEGEEMPALPQSSR